MTTVQGGLKWETLGKTLTSLFTTRRFTRAWGKGFWLKSRVQIDRQFYTSLHHRISLSDNFSLTPISRVSAQRKQRGKKLTGEKQRKLSSKAANFTKATFKLQAKAHQI